LVAACSTAAPTQPPDDTRWSTSSFSRFLRTTVNEVAWTEGDRHAWVRRVIDGKPSGPVTDIGTFESDEPIITASNGATRLACLEAFSQIRCKRDGATLFEVEGSRATLAYSASGWALSYSVGTTSVLQRLAQDGSLLGEPKRLSTDQRIVAFAAYGNGFVALDAGVRPPAGLRTALLRFLDGTFAQIGEPLDLGKPVWITNVAAVATTDSEVAVSLARPYGSYLILVRDLPSGRTITTREVAGGVKNGIDVRLAASASGFDALWYNPPSNHAEGLYTTTVEGTLDPVRLGDNAVATLVGGGFYAKAENGAIVIMPLR
jgi:hypothetical protein